MEKGVVQDMGPKEKQLKVVEADDDIPEAFWQCRLTD